MKIILSFLLLLFFSLSNLNADYLYGKYDKCVNDFYYKSGTFYYHYSKDDNSTWYYTTSNDYYKYLYDGFDYNSTTDICRPVVIPFKLGIDYHSYKFLMALIGLLVSFSFVFSFLFIFVRKV